MIIDIHTHTYPEAIAAKAINRLARKNNIYNYTDGTINALIKSQAEAGIDYSVLLPVVARPEQIDTINRIASQINESTSHTHLISFAGIHPDNDDYRAQLHMIKEAGFPGIKIHPMFQQVPLDDIRYIRIIDEALSLGLFVLIHGGGDISFLDCDYAMPKRTSKMLSQLPDTSGIILAHMGGILYWSEVIDQLSQYNIYLDTSSSIWRFLSYDGVQVDGPFRTPLDKQLFLDIVAAFGTDRILFGSDSPWCSQKQSIEELKESGLSPNQLLAVLGENASKLLHNWIK